MSFLCYLCHLGPNRGFRFLPFWKTAIIFLSLNRYVWFIQGEMAKCGCAAPFCAACMGGSGVACAAVMHGCASFAQRLRAGLRPSRGGHARACVLLKAVAGGSAPTGATASEGVCVRWRICVLGTCVWRTCVRGTCVWEHLRPMDTRVRGASASGPLPATQAFLRADRIRGSVIRAHPHPG